MSDLPENFEKYFSEVYGPRWGRLLLSLQADEHQVRRPNAFAEHSEAEGVGSSQNEPKAGQSSQGPAEIPRAENGLLSFYVMDPASILAARALDVQAGDRVLDMCAAPGGKTLILAEAIRESGELIANELSEARRERLKKVIQQYVSRETRERVWITGKDGGKFALTERDGFDRILVDAPCSGERHLLQNKKELSEWSISRSERLAQRQYALLTAALLACKPGGRIVYSTCSISPLENDGVIEKLLKKKDGFSVVMPVLPDLSGAELTKHGVQIFPDVCAAGPIYYSVLQKS